MHTGAVAIHLSKVVMTAGLSLWAALVTLGNVANFDSYCSGSKLSAISCCLFRT